MFISFIFVSIICTAVVYGTRNFCPVSSLVDVVRDQMNPLPIDVFDIDAMSTINPASIYGCVSATGEKHSCTIETRCPLDEEDLLAFTSLGTGALDSFCDIRKAMKDPRKLIRVEVYGGSMTYGAAAFGCCCDHDVEPRCPNKKLDDRCGRVTAMGGEEMCRWGNRLETWLKNVSTGNVQYHNHAYSGANSLEAGHYITKDTKGSIYTKYDIIFLDFSVNDAKFFAKRGSNEELRLALQNLIRQIFYNSEPDSWPTVVLLEEYMWTNGMQSNHQFDKTGNYDYASIYTSVAKEFKIPLWSYRYTSYRQTYRLLSPVSRLTVFFYA